MNIKDERIYKLWQRGLKPEQIARKIGMPNYVQRVYEGLSRKGVQFDPQLLKRP